MSDKDNLKTGKTTKINKIVRPVISVKKITKKYGSSMILKGISFDIYPGERIAIIGANGAGKSTLSEIIAQIRMPTSGKVEFSFGNSKKEISKNIGIQFQDSKYPMFVKTIDIINFFVDASGNKINKKVLDDLMEILHLNGIEKNYAQSLSGGQQQRLNILLALIHEPKLLILDELSTGLDIESKEKIKIYIDNYLNNYKDSTLILVSHNVEEIKYLCDRVIVIHNGLIFEDILVKEAEKKYGSFEKYSHNLFSVEFPKMEKESLNIGGNK